MKRLNLYIGKSLLQTTVLSFFVLTFVLVSGSLFRAFDLLARGFSPLLVGRFLLYMIPFALQFTLPFAVLCASVLVFSRMSADNELAAMRASGVSLWQIISPGLLLATLLTVLCIHLQMELAPECRYRAHQLRTGEEVQNPLAFLEPGRHVQFSRHVVYIGSRHGSSLSDIQLYRLDEAGRVVQDITAPRGTVRFDPRDRVLDLTLQDAVMGVVDRTGGGDRDRMQHVAGNLTYEIDYAGGGSRAERLAKKPKYMGAKQILSTIYIYNKSGEPTTPLYVELHKRMSLAFAPIGFFLIGIPFGIRTRRTEISVGAVVSLILAAVFYMFLMLADSLGGRPEYHPEVLVWIPNIIYQVGGLWALNRISGSRH